MPAAPADATLKAAGLILIYAAIIGFTDNYVRVIAAEAGLWQFHLTRSTGAFALLALVAVPLGLRLRPRNWRAVTARSVIHGLAMVIYFGGLAFLPVALVAAGSLLGVGMMVRAYQIADATRVSVFEYMILPASALWGWLIWGEVLSLQAVAGMALIVGAGLMIALRARVG